MAANNKLTEKHEINIDFFIKLVTGALGLQPFTSVAALGFLLANNTVKSSCNFIKIAIYTNLK